MAAEEQEAEDDTASRTFDDDDVDVVMEIMSMMDYDYLMDRKSLQRSNKFWNLVCTTIHVQQRVADYWQIWYKILCKMGNLNPFYEREGSFPRPLYVER
jgi:hypothetical protein